MGMILKGLSQLRSKFDKFIKRQDTRVADLRKNIAAELLDAIIENTPVWSGRTVRSLMVSNTAGSSNAAESHPDRGDRSPDGRWDSHPEFGDTKSMPIGSEPMRGAAQAIARASLQMTKFGVDDRVYITSSSYNWDDVDTGRHSYFHPVRQVAQGKVVISELAIAQVRSMFGKAVK
jgi:hypothetical protein